GALELPPEHRGRRRDHRQWQPRLRPGRVPPRAAGERECHPTQGRPGARGRGFGLGDGRARIGSDRPGRPELEPGNPARDLRHGARHPGHDRHRLAAVAPAGEGTGAPCPARRPVRPPRLARHDDERVRRGGPRQAAALDHPGRVPAGRGRGRRLVPIAAVGPLGARRRDRGQLPRGAAGAASAEGERVTGARAGDAPRIHRTALVEPGVRIGARTTVWDGVHLRGPSTIGHDCIVGEKTYVAYGVEIGNFVKINAMVYIPTGITIEDRVMIAAGVIFTNDRYPRAFDELRGGLADSGPGEDTLPGRVKTGATVGAGSVVGPGLTIGAYAMVG